MAEPAPAPAESAAAESGHMGAPPPGKKQLLNEEFDLDIAEPDEDAEATLGEYDALADLGVEPLEKRVSTNIRDGWGRGSFRKLVFAIIFTLYDDSVIIIVKFDNLSIPVTIFIFDTDS